MKSKNAGMIFKKYARREPEVRAHVSSARQKAEEARASLASTQNRGSVLTGLMRLKESGRIDGFHGRLGNLGTIDEKYDVAISTACPALDNMVVDTVEVGQQCIDYLRKTISAEPTSSSWTVCPRVICQPSYTPEKCSPSLRPRQAQGFHVCTGILQCYAKYPGCQGPGTGKPNRLWSARRWRV